MIVKNKAHLKENVISNHRQRILQYLMHNPVMTFNQLWDKEGRSNNFAYHIKSLEKEKLIEKIPEGYRLTKRGITYVSYLQGDSAEELMLPIMAVAVVVVKNDRFLMLQRNKEPFHGYWGFPGGKIKFSQYILESAADCLKEDTGLECNLKLKGLFSSKTFDNSDLIFNHEIFVVKAENPKGILIGETDKGINKFVSRKDLKKISLLPNINLLIDIALGDEFRWVEADRFEEKNKFKDIKVKKDVKL